MKTIRIFLLFLSVTLAGCAAEKAPSHEAMCEAGIRLARELLEKLKADTPFTLEEERHFFGGPTDLNEPNLIYLQLGYVSPQKKLLKPLPKYSYFGELLRMNRDLFLNEARPAPRYLAGVTASIGKIANMKGEIIREDALRHDTDVWITVFVIYGEVRSEFSVTDEKLLRFNYNGVARVLFGRMAVNGKTVMEELGFYCNSLEDMGLREDVLERLQARMRQIEN